MRGPQFEKAVNRLSQAFGSVAGWISAVLVLLICGDVAMRYILDRSQVWMLELEWHLFALIFLFGAAYTMQEDQHVRVDLIYNRLSKWGKAWVDLLGSLFLLLPFCLVVLVSSSRYAWLAFEIGERSSDPGGLPARWLIKFAVVLGFGLLLLQGLVLITRSLVTLLNHPHKTGEDD